MKKKVKLSPLFRKKYTEKQYQKKILKKLFIASDKELIESSFITVQEPKKGKTLYQINPESIATEEQIEELNGIAEQLKLQKGRFNFVAIISGLACILILALVLTVFRNPLSRLILTSALEGSFGAKCEIGRIDFDLLNTRFTAEHIAVANKDAPMKNLFEIGKTELYFNLLEMTRGKLVVENVEVTKVQWNTVRAKSGALSVKKQKAFDKKQKKAKPNPVTASITNEVGKITSGVSADSGIAAIKNQLDPVQFFEKEKASLLSPPIVAQISSTVPALSSKWDAKSTEVRADVDKTISDGKKVSELKVDSIKTVEEAKIALNDINAAIASTQKSVALAQETSQAISADTSTVSALSKNAETAMKADTLRIKNMTDSVKALNLDSGKGMISGVFNTYLITKLGSFYPYAEKGLSFLRNMQNAKKKNEKPTMESKSSAIERLAGREFIFGDNSMPKILFKNVSVSAIDEANGISGSAIIQNITDDADRINKPIFLKLDSTQKNMSEYVSGTIDLRTLAEYLVNSEFTVAGYPLVLDSGAQTGVPSIAGNLKAAGTFSIAPDETVRISSGLFVSNAKATVAAFEPEFLYSSFNDSLSDIKEIKLDVKAEISGKNGVNLDIKTDLDSVLNKALQGQVSKQVEQFKAGVRKQGDSYLAEQKKIYSAEIGRFNEISGKANSALADIKKNEQVLQSKKAEAEKRIQSIAMEKAAPVQKAATDAGLNAANSIRKLF